MTSHPGPGQAPAAPSGAATSTTAVTREVAHFGWGGATGDLGRLRPEEGNPEAPMSLAAGRGGSMLVLDQVNQRLVRLRPDGSIEGSVALPVQAAQDVALARDGTTLVLDRLADKAVALIAPSGELRGELPLLGKGITEGGAVTGVFADGDDVYVEREHGDLVKLGSTDGRPDADRTEIPGRPTRDGSGYVTANLAGADAVALTFIERPSKRHRYTVRQVYAAPVVAIVLLDSDAAGRLYLGALTQAHPQTPRFEVSVLCLEPSDGRAIGRAVLPANDDPDETFRELTVSDEGGVLYLHRTPSGAAVLLAPCGPL